MRRPLRFRPWMLVSAVWLAPAVLATVNRVAQSRLDHEPLPPIRQLLFTGGDWMVYAILVPPVFAIVRRWPIERPHTVSRAWLHLGFALAFCVAWATSGKLLELVLRLIFDPGTVQAAAAAPDFLATIWRDWLGWVLTTLPFGVVVYLCIAGIAHAIRYFVETSEREVQVARLSEQLSGARFSALQAQLNPHFLFNTLNTIAVRARDGDSQGTVRMVEQLADILRRTLTRHRANEVRLEAELSLVRQYLAIEQARFSDRLQPAFDVSPAVLTAAVPGFAVQHLVENAIRHGIARRSDAGHVTVSARRVDALQSPEGVETVEVSVTDDGPGPGTVIADTRGEPGRFPEGHGLDNTRERLRALYGNPASLRVTPGEAGGTVATLRLPYRELPEEVDDAGR